MMKVCPRCTATWAGGAFCPTCGVHQPLTDMASAAGRAYLVDDETNRAVQVHYAERRGMVRTFMGLFSSLAVAAFLFRAGFGSEGNGRFGWWTLAALVGGLGAYSAIRHARGLAARAAGSANYVCPDEGDSLPNEAPPTRGFGWLRW